MCRAFLNARSHPELVSAQRLVARVILNLFQDLILIIPSKNEIADQVRNDNVVRSFWEKLEVNSE